jgi:hypothetical protein
MHDDIGLCLGHKAQNSFAVANVEVAVIVAFDLRPKPLQRPAGAALGAKENRPLIVVDTADGVPVARQMDADFRTDQPA